MSQSFKPNFTYKFDRFLLSLMPTPVLKEYYCRISRKLAQRGILNNHVAIKTDEGFFLNLNKLDSVSWRIYFADAHEHNIGRIIKERLGPGDVFVDVGANVGYFSMIGAQAVGPAGQVIAYEASPSNTILIKKNLEMNEFENIDIRNEAVSAEAGIVKLYGSDPALLAQKSLLASRGGTVEAEVPSVPLTVKSIGVDPSRIRLIKIDVEGAEQMVVDGMHQLLDTPGFAGEIILEITPADFVKGRNGLLDPFLSRGYRMFRIPNPQELRKYFEPLESMSWNEINAEDVNEMMDVLFTKRLH